MRRSVVMFSKWTCVGRWLRVESEGSGVRCDECVMERCRGKGRMGYVMGTCVGVGEEGGVGAEVA